MVVGIIDSVMRAVLSSVLHLAGVVMGAFLAVFCGEALAVCMDVDWRLLPIAVLQCQARRHLVLLLCSGIAVVSGDCVV